jgi:gas vesicle protein
MPGGGVGLALVGAAVGLAVVAASAGLVGAEDSAVVAREDVSDEPDNRND